MSLAFCLDEMYNKYGREIQESIQLALKPD